VNKRHNVVAHTGRRRKWGTEVRVVDRDVRVVYLMLYKGNGVVCMSMSLSLSKNPQASDCERVMVWYSGWYGMVV
jgi:hypothetical protein